jgi:multiple sugar transport system permease protein/putative aldouronate transport system permease protein
VFAFITLLCIYPFYYLFINTISANDLSANGVINFYPQQIHLKNYIDIIKIQGLSQAAFISFARTAVGTICTVMASGFLGFMFTQKKMWKRKLWYRYFIVTMYFNAGLIPIFIIMLNLGLVNNFLVYIIPLIIQPFFVILAKTYIESIPNALQEAAEIDGAGIMLIFFKIILPITVPILATIAIFAAVGQWNSFYDVLIYVSRESLQPLQFVLYKYINQSNSLAMLIRNSPGLSGEAIANLATKQTPTSVRMTVSVIVVFPILMVYPFFQRYFVKGIMIGAVKG